MRVAVPGCYRCALPFYKINIDDQNIYINLQNELRLFDFVSKLKNVYEIYFV